MADQPGLPAIVLRAPQASDVPVLMELRNDVPLQRQLMAVARGSSEADVRAWMDRRHADPAGLFFVVSDASRKPLGYVQITAISGTPPHGWLGICLARAAQGRGIGGQALRQLEDAARQRHLAKLLLAVLHDNHPARRLYARCGYREVGVLERHFVDAAGAQDALLLEKLL